MRVCHGFTARFDDPNLVSCAGLGPVPHLAERAGLHRLAAEHVRIDEQGGRFAAVKVPGLVAGMVAGADSIEDMDLLRHGGMGRLFAGCGRRRARHVLAVVLLRPMSVSWTRSRPGC
jgi:hypothetical protein